MGLRHLKQHLNHCSVQSISTDLTHYTHASSASVSLVFAQPIICEACPSLLKSHFLPLMEKLRKRTESILQEEERMKTDAASHSDRSEAELRIQEKFMVLVRDLYAFYLLLIPFVDAKR